MAVSLSLTPQSAAALHSLQRELLSLPGEVALATEAEVGLVAEELRRLVIDEFKRGTDKHGRTHDKSGKVEERTTIDHAGLDAVITMTGPGYLLTEEGSQAHIISAKPGGVLHWTEEGGDAFARSVHHPGVQPDHFVERALDRLGLDAGYAAILERVFIHQGGYTPKHGSFSRLLQ